MKIRVTLKDPDALHDQVQDAVGMSFAATPGLSGEEIEAASEVRTKKALEVCEKWFRWSEYLTVEIDTEAETCVVLEKKDL